MRISGVAKKSLALVLTMAVAVGGVAISPSNASAAKKKSASVKVRTYFAGNTKDADCIWVYGDGKEAPKNEKTIKLTKGKKTKVSVTIKKPATYDVSGKKVKLKKMAGATVLTVDLVDVLSSFKKVKCSGIVVKCDGKTVKQKVYQGSFEKNKADSKNNWRLSFYNKWGNQGDNSKNNKATAFGFKKNITISFTVTPK